MDVITISRQPASGGYEIGAAVARRLGYRLVCRDLILQAAQRVGAPEMGLASFDELGLLGISPTERVIRAYRRAVNEVMTELADRGKVVIVGRAGQVILRGREDTFHVRVIAPAERRAQRLADETGISMRAARAQIAARDQFRKQYLSQMYRIDPDDAMFYHLVINTDRMKIRQAVDLVCMIVQKGKKHVGARG